MRAIQKWIRLCMLLACLGASIPFARGQNYVLNENFDAGTNPGWLFSTTAGGNDWKVVTTGGVSNTGSLYNKYMGGTGIPNFALSTGYTFTAGITYTCRFTIKSGATNRRNFFACFNSTRARNGSETIITSVTNVGTAFTTYNATFTVPTTGTYYMLYYLTYIGGSTYNTIFLDDLQVFWTNSPPSVSLTYPASATTLTAGSSATLAATATDADGTIDSVVFYNNGARLGRDLTSPYTFGWTVPAGANSITARAYDNGGANTLSSATVLTGNQAPSVSLTYPASATTVLVGTSATLATTATDADGTVDSVVFFSNGTRLGRDVSSPFTLDWTVPAGTNSITARAYDNGGANTLSNANNLTGNIAPTVSINSPANNSYAATGSILTISVNAADADGSVAKVSFYDGATLLGEDMTSPFSLAWTITSGSHNLTAIAEDNDGATTTSSAIVVIGNLPPTATLTSPAALALIASGNIVLTADASDPDGAIIKVEFFANGAKVGEDLTAPFSFTWAATSGSYALYALATDAAGTTGQSAFVNVVVTDRPTLSITSPANNATIEAGNIYIRTAATDADGSIDRVIFYNGSTIIGNDSVAPYQLVYNFLVGSYPNLKAVATDNLGMTSLDANLSITVTSPSAAVLFNNDFNVALNGFFLPNGNVSHNWKYWVGSGVGGTNCLHSKLPNANDFVASPAVTLSGTNEYNAVWKARLDKGSSSRRIVVGYNSTATHLGAIWVDSVQLPANSYATPNYVTYASRLSPPVAGTYYVLWKAVGSGYVDAYLDDLSLEKNNLPTVSLTSPVANATFNEGVSILLEATAADLDGTVKKVEFYDGTTKIGEDTTAPYSFNWTNYLPGVRSIFAKAIDNRGNIVTSTGIPIQINFSDGTLSTYIHWSFEQGVTPWTVGPNCSVQTKNSIGYNGSNNYWLFYINSGQLGEIISPKVYLFAGTTYKFEYRPNPAGTSSRTIRWYVNNQNAITGATQVSTWTGTNANAFAKQTFTFTVPADGAYYMIWNSVQTGYTQVYMDENRLIGNINSAPQVSVTSPANNILAGEGSKIKFAVNALDLDGQVQYVAFFANGHEIGRDSTAPYTLTYSALTPGSYTWYAEAKDDRNGFGSSLPQTITIDPSRIQASSYLGSDGAAEDVRGTVIQSDGTLVLAANIGSTNPGGVSATLLNGATATSGGAIIRLSNNGQTVLSVTRVAAKVGDLSKDAAGNLYLACANQGLIKLDATAGAVVWARTFDKAVLRVDAGPAGNTAIMTATTEDFNAFTIGGATIRIHDPNGIELSNYGGPSQYNHDVCIDEASGTVISIGTKNFYTSSSGGSSLPVYVAACQGRDFAGTLKFTMYDWIGDNTSPRWINRSDNNMADVRASRCMIGADGKLYILFETFGGNHHLRYDPFDIMKPTPAVGGDNYFTMSNTGTETHIYVGKYVPGTGAFIQGQNLTNRLTNGKGNTIVGQQAGMATDILGRLYIVTSTATGLPINYEYLSGEYSGGAALVMLSPDFRNRDIVTRFATSGYGFSIAVSGEQILLGGRVTSNDLYTRNALQSTQSGSQDAFFLTANYNNMFSYKAGVHPRLFFSAAEVPAIRSKLTQEPFASMLTRLQQTLTQNEFGNGPIDTVTDTYDIVILAHNHANLYMLTGNEYHAIQAKRWVDTIINGNAGVAWASTSLKGLTSFYLATKVAIIYDLCYNSSNWDEVFKYNVSFRLREMADMITTNGGTEQNSDLASNWQGSRGASAGIAYLALDHKYTAANLTTSYGKVTNYINNNLGSQTASKGWNVEGLGYTYYPWGPMIGPFGIAMARSNPANNLRNIASVRNQYWTGWAVNSTAANLGGFNGYRPDFSDDNPHISGEGFLGQSFYYMDSTLLGAARYCYDKLVGSSNAAPTYDVARGGTLFSILYYPTSINTQDPMSVSEWRNNFTDAQGNGFYTYRNAYQDANDHIAQFRAKHRNSAGSHDAPDGLGFRIIGNGNPWAIGGGRDAPGRERLQNGLYTVTPVTGTFTSNRNLGTLVGTPVSMTDGSGHTIASMTTNSVGVGTHKRWFVANYNTAQTGADAMYIVGDESTNGQFWSINTHQDNVITTSGNTFTITAPDGSTLKGTVLQPTTNFRFVTSTGTRGSGYGTATTNQCLNLQSDNGDYLIVMTLEKAGQSHPSVTYTGTAIVNSVVKVGTLSCSILATDVTYAYNTRLTALSNTLDADVLAVYPNPTNGQDLTVRLEPTYYGQPLQIVMTDAVGKVWSDRRMTATELNTLSTAGIPAGLYNLNIILPTGRTALKVVVTH